MIRSPLAILAAFISFALVVPPTRAASPPPPGPVATVCDSCSAVLAVTSSTGRVALPLSVTNNPSMVALTILNTGTKDAFFKFGDVTVTAVTTNTRLAAGRSLVVSVNGATYLAAITAGSDTTALQIWQANGPVNLNGPGAATPGLPTGAATAANQSAGTSAAPSSVIQTVQPVRSAPIYFATQAAYAAYATPTDMACLPGSATKVIYPLQIFVNLHATAASFITVNFVKRSTANTGGGASSPTAASYDSGNPAATTTPVFYSSAPSLGSAVGTTYILEVLTATLVAANSNSVSNGFSSSQIIPIGPYEALRGTGESICVNLGGAALPAGFTSNFTWQWIEQ